MKNMNKFETIPSQEKEPNFEEMDAGLDAQKDWLDDEIDSKGYRELLKKAKKLLSL